MIRNTDRELILGQMAESMLEIGKMANNMEEENIFYQVGNPKLENGVKGERFDGFRTGRIKFQKRLQLPGDCKILLFV